MSDHPETPTESAAVILPRAEHDISRRQISENSLKVLYRLNRHGYKAYLVGGGVRDLLLGRTPKDFDVGTDATPNQVKQLFRNCFLVGRRFRLAHIRFAGNEVIEVATFRRQATADDLPEHPDDQPYFAENIFGTPEQDALRRDFTINALYYDIETFSIIDHVGGLEDLDARRLRVIGDPLVRFTEDPVRMLRALEFAARLDFSLDEAAREGIYSRAPLIAEAAPARIREELMELFRHKVAGQVLRSARGFGLLEHLIPGFRAEERTFALLDRLDARTAAGGELTEHLALAALYLERFWSHCPPDSDHNLAEVVKLAGQVLTPHCAYFHIAHGIRHLARELLLGCFRLSRGLQRRGQQRFLRHPMAPLSLELLELWAGGDAGYTELIAQWRAALADPDGQAAPAAASGARRRRRRRGRRRPRSAT